MNESEDKEKQNLPADDENDGYISFFSLKIINRPVNLGKGMRSLTYLVNIKSKKYQVKY